VIALTTLKLLNENRIDAAHINRHFSADGPKWRCIGFFANAGNIGSDIPNLPRAAPEIEAHELAKGSSSSVLIVDRDVVIKLRASELFRQPMSRVCVNVLDEFR
jgi:hypothetical protein